ncbi:ribonuclease R [Urechidicola croceus]|uniref:Ribonuclease R n=1 Tax=Urechidicola croceus TaxID=1850246 RepID=A0A1D8P956_9FLAO|nr:ribonuclease R [Urechidicola croceus]AOW21108.1 ribonuclease R [Urechidicola croceus]
MSKRKKRLYKKKNNTIKHLTEKVIKIFNQNSSQSFNYKQVASKLKIEDANGKQQIIEKIEALKVAGKLEEIDRGKYKIIQSDNYFTGKVDITSRGNAYVICEELEHDIYIPSRNINHALHNDLVKVYVYNRKINTKQEGDIVEIIERAKTEFVGVLQMNKTFGFVIPDDNKMYADVFVSQKKLNDAKDGDKVLVKITDWPDNSKNPFGKIKQVLGRPGDHNTEIHSILLEYDLPYEFPPEVEKDASTLPIEITNEEISKRRDMRETTTFTIDPKDAKDFDDALSFKKLENGNYEVGIHIADVSHYVEEDTILDEEAYARATSVYLVDRVVPMLPEILSNNVCSLRPNEEKLTFSAVFEIDEKAQIRNQWFGRTVIYSDARFAYEEAQHLIENPESNTIPEDLSLTGEAYEVIPEVKEATLVLDKLAKKLRKRRLQQGAITFDRVEVRFNIDENAVPTGVYFKESKDANKLIEEFMLLANRKVAEFIGSDKGRPSNKTFIYRIHDEPNMDKLEALQGIISKFGYRINTESKKKISETLNKLLTDVHGKGESNMIETLAIRSMSKAIYTTDNIGHYGLAFDYYSHFTSPIRRYPDVMTHRLLQHYLDGGKSPKQAIYEEKCEHSSDREQLAAKAERDSIKYMQVKYMQDHQDQEFRGVVSGVTEWGIYVEIIENKCEGMVRIRDIKDDYYIFDEKQYAIVGQSTKNMIQLGDEVTVKVKHTDLERKHLDFTLISDE